MSYQAPKKDRNKANAKDYPENLGFERMDEKELASHIDTAREVRSMGWPDEHYERVILELILTRRGA